MKTIVALIFCLFAVFALGCEYEEAIENAEFNIDGKSYKIEITEAAANTTTTEPVTSEPEPVEYTTSLRPPIAKHLLIDSDGTEYLINSYSKADTITISKYWIKDKDSWVYLKEIKEFPLNVHIELYPGGGDFGVEYPPSDFNVYVQMADGTLYVMKQGNKIIPVDQNTIRIYRYFVREAENGRWYYYEDPKDIPKKEAKII